MADFTFSDLKLGFISYLETECNIEVDTDSDGEADINIFDYRDELQDYIEIKLGEDFDDVIDMRKIKNLTYKDGEFTTKDKSYSEEKDFYAEVLNEFFSQEDIKESVDENADKFADVDGDGEITDEEMGDYLIDILKTANESDDDKKMFSFEDIFSAFDDIEGGDFEFPENEIPDEEPESSSSSSGGGGGGGGSSSSSSSSNSTNNSDKTDSNPLDNMTLDELEAEKELRSNELNEKQDALGSVNNEVEGDKTTFEDAQKAYNETLKAQNIPNDELIQAQENIKNKETEIDTARVEVEKTKTEIVSQKDLIVQLDTNLQAMNISKGQLEAQIQQASSSDTQTQGETPAVDTAALEAQLAKINEQITSQTKQLEEAKTKLTELETQLTEKETTLTTKETEKTELETKEQELEATIMANADEELKTAYDAMTKARDTYKENKTTKVNEAKSNLDLARQNMSEINNKVTEVSANTLIESTAGVEAGSSNFVENGDNYNVIHDLEKDGMKYMLITPKNIDPNKEYPLMVSLHGSGKDGNSTARMETSEIGAAILGSKLQDFDGFIICPVTSGNWLNDTKMNQVMGILDEVRGNYNIDSKNIGLAGFSAGANGALYIGAANKDVFSKVAILSGYRTNDTPSDGERHIVTAKDFKEGQIRGYYGSADDSGSKDDYMTTMFGGELIEIYGTHGDVPSGAFNKDDGNGKSDLLEWMFGESAKPTYQKVEVPDTNYKAGDFDKKDTTDTTTDEKEDEKKEEN